MAILIKRKDPIKPSEITDKSVWLSRRHLLQAAGVIGMGLASYPLAALVSSPGKLKAIQGVRESGHGADLALTDYEDVTSYNNFYEFGTGKDDPVKNAHLLKTRPWHVKVDGECEAPGEIDIEDVLSGFDQEERIYRFRCVEAWSMVVPWVGFPLSDLLKRFKPTSKAKYVAFETLVDSEQMPGQKRKVLDWPYREGLRMDEAMHPLTLMATGLYGEILPNQNGAPLRLVLPWKYGFKSIKSIVRITFTEKEPYTSWSALAPHEYGFYANVNPQVDHPRWSQKYHRLIGEGIFAKKQKTLFMNGYADEVAGLYAGMDLAKYI